MKGYFSELARHSGLRIGDRGPAATALAAPPLSQQNIKGLEMEEVAFINSSQTHAAERLTVAEPKGVETISTEAVRSIPQPSDARRSDLAHTDRNTDAESDFYRPQFLPDATVEVTPASNPAGAKTGAKERSVSSADMETAIIEQPRVVISEHISMPAQAPVANQIPESVSALEERNEISEVERFDLPDRSKTTSGAPIELDRGRFARAAEQSYEGLDERIERQTIVRNYLQEISEWISTPASLEEAPDYFISADSVASAEDQVGRPAGPNATLPGRLRADALEQQDLSLSIGTIKIVVEEPRKEAPAPPALPAPPAKSERTFERTTTVPTDLSRYYLNRW